MFDANSRIRNQIYAMMAEFGYEAADFEISDEQSFAKKKDLRPKTVYVLTRALQNDIGIGVDTQPLQMLVLTEQNEIERTKGFFAEYAKRYNFDAFTEDYSDGGASYTRYVKQQYTEPVVLSNFNAVSYGYRSVLYMSATFLVLDRYVDLHGLTIDGESVTPLSASLSYGMSPNTQQLSTGYISRSVKSMSTLSLTIDVPVLEDALFDKAMAIIAETDDASTDVDEDDQVVDPTSYGGNENFYVSFYVGSKLIEKRMKLTVFEFTHAVDSIPTMHIGFME